MLPVLPTLLALSIVNSNSRTYLVRWASFQLQLFGSLIAIDAATVDAKRWLTIMAFIFVLISCSWWLRLQVNVSNGNKNTETKITLIQMHANMPPDDIFEEIVHSTRRQPKQSNAHGPAVRSIHYKKGFRYLWQASGTISAELMRTTILTETHVVVMRCNGTIKMVKWIRVRMCAAMQRRRDGRRQRFQARSWQTDDRLKRGTRIHGVSHDSIVSCCLKFSMVRVVNARNSFERSGLSHGFPSR